MDLIINDFQGRDAQLGGLFLGLMAKGPTVEEVCCLIDVILELDDAVNTNKQTVDLPNGEKLITTIGSGKKGFKTFNISTPSLLVAASAGAYCYKPVSASTSSLTGSSDFLKMVGVNLDLTQDEVIDSLKTVGFGAFNIEKVIPKFDKIYGGKFYTPHILSFGLPALATPIKPDRVLYGISHPNVTLAASVLQRYGFENSMIVSSTHNNVHYIDELIPMGQNHVCGVIGGQRGPTISFRASRELSLNRYRIEDIKEGLTAEDNVKIAVKVLAGKGSPAQTDTVCLNAGNLLYLAGKVPDYTDGFFKAKKMISSGAAIEKLFEVIKSTRGDSTIVERILEEKDDSSDEMESFYYNPKFAKSEENIINFGS